MVALVGAIFVLSGSLGDSGPLAPSQARGGAGAGVLGSQPGQVGAPGQPGQPGHTGTTGPGQPLATVVAAPPPGTTVAPTAGSPDSPDPSPSASNSADQSGQSIDKTFNTAGGVVVAGCTKDSNRAVIRDASAADADGYMIRRRKDGPAPTVGVVFKSATSTVRVLITCQNGVPTLRQDSVDAVPTV